VTSELETWQRKHYVAGGGDPFLFYVVYGEIDSSAPLSRSAYRSNGIPADKKVGKNHSTLPFEHRDHEIPGPAATEDEQMLDDHVLPSAKSRFDEGSKFLSVTGVAPSARRAALLVFACLYREWLNY
jgi:hypothetical protein